MSNNRPKIGTGAIIFNDKGQLLFGKRTYNPTGYSVPGGHIEFGETIEDCCKREVLEEAGIIIENLEIVTWGENIYLDKDHHSVSAFVFCTAKKGQEPKNMEPDKCDGWEWFDIDEIPKNLSFNYDPVLKHGQHLIKAYKEKHL